MSELLEKAGLLKPHSVYGVMGAFDEPDALLEAGRKVRAEGYTKLDAMMPFPMHHVNEALGIRRSHLGWIVVCIGLTGTAAALFLQWYTGAGPENLMPGWTGLGAYPLVIGGKPTFDFTFAMPVTFELTVLFSAFAAFFGLWAVNGLPRMYHPSMNYSQSHRATDDKFVLVVEADDPLFDAKKTADLLKPLGARDVEVVEG